jgi:Fur family zinc uptake transcriptional regulator
MSGSAWINQVEVACRGRGLQMTALRREVVGIFASAEHPLGAYAIIQKLSESQRRIVAPPTVYRTLDFLVENGFVVKIESRQTYVACAHIGHDHDHHGIVFSCTRCGRTVEVESKAVDDEMTSIAEKLGFRSEHKVCEVAGLCAECGSA